MATKRHSASEPLFKITSQTASSSLLKFHASEQLAIELRVLKKLLPIWSDLLEIELLRDQDRKSGSTQVSILSKSAEVEDDGTSGVVFADLLIGFVLAAQCNHPV